MLSSNALPAPRIVKREPVPDYSGRRICGVKVIPKINPSGEIKPLMYCARDPAACRFASEGDRAA
jgi:hypothetical protein